jgi:hypothetical protein
VRTLESSTRKKTHQRETVFERGLLPWPKR